MTKTSKDTKFTKSTYLSPIALFLAILSVISIFTPMLASIHATITALLSFGAIFIGFESLKYRKQSEIIPPISIILGIFSLSYMTLLLYLANNIGKISG